MLAFCGLDRCSVDANGRIKLSPRVIEDFARRGSDVVLHCLPEGAVAVYPEDIYLEMRRSVPDPAQRREAWCFAGLCADSAHGVSRKRFPRRGGSRSRRNTEIMRGLFRAAT